MIVAVETFLGWADDHLARQRPEFHARLRPALQGLALTAAGGSLDEQDQSGRAGEARRFLGQSMERHWLLQ